MRFRLFSKIGCLTLSLFFTLTLTGCFSSPLAAKRISAFYAATTDVSENVADAFKSVDEAYIATATEEAVAKIAAGEKVNPKEVAKPFLDAKEYEARAALLRALSEYAGLLAEIMGDSPRKKLDAQVDKLAASLKSLSSDTTLQGMLGNEKVLTKEEIGIIATGINEIAGLIIDYKRKKDIKDIIKNANPHIEKICAALQKDIGGKRDVPGLRSQLYASYDKRIQERFEWIKTNSESKSGRKVFTPLEQRAEILSWLYMVQDQAKADGAMERIYRSIGTLVATHDKLSTAFDDSATELDELIGLLKSEADRVKNRYEVLKK